MGDAKIFRREYQDLSYPRYDEYSKTYTMKDIYKSTYSSENIITLSPSDYYYHDEQDVNKALVKVKDKTNG
jgi:hypothetical protein